jgi:protein-S-isoprenylcysteine O-methyltransferase Ste14
MPETEPQKREAEMEQSVIGITKADKWRESRTKDTEKLAKEVVDISAYDKVALISLPSLDLLREAYSCYQNGAYMGTAIMCRAVTEAVVYFSLARRTNKPKDFGGGLVKIDFDWIDAEWGNILKDAKKAGIVNDKLIGRIDYIRSYGNATVHYGQYEDKAWLKMQHGKVVDAPHGWIGREKALELLHKTIGIFNEVIKGQANAIKNEKKSKKGRGNKLVPTLITSGFLFIVFIMPFLNAIWMILLSLHTGTLAYLEWGLSVFLFYFIAWMLIVMPAKFFGIELPKEGQFTSAKGFLRSFPFYAIAVLFLSSWNAPSGNAIGIAIGAAAVLLYYQYVVEYVSKMF